MHRSFRLIVCFAVLLLGGALQAQAQFSIRAASSEPVPGWDRVEVDNRVIWISPTASLTAADVASSGQTTRPDGRIAVGVTFTETGAGKMRTLSTAQLNKPIAIMLDGKVLSAPTVRGEIGKEALITGNGPNGLTADEVQKLLASLNRK